LILRLLRKDVKLANRLFFELVSTSSAEEQRDKVENRLLFLVRKGEENEHYSIGSLNWDNTSLNLSLAKT
jgi:hypothetical protein